MSSLDYDEELALPMPKPRHMRIDWDNISNPFEDDTERSNVMKKRFPTDPIVPTVHATPEPVSLPDGPDSKKKSRFEMIKSKLSFKDLRKEINKEDPALHSPMPPHHVLNESSIATLTSNEGTKMKAKMQPPTMVRSTTSKTLHHSNKKLPLPSSGTFSNVKVPKTTIVREGSRRVSSMGDGPPSSTSPFDMKVISTPGHSTLTPVAPERRRPAVAIPTSTSTRKPLLLNTASVPKDPVPDDFSPNLRDLTEGDGKVKYLPKTWLDGSFRPVSDGNPQTLPILPPTFYSDSDSPVESHHSYLPSLTERLDKLDLSHKNSLSEGQNCSTPIQIDEILDMVNSIQRKVDGGAISMNRKLEELYAWIGDQLQHQIQNSGDLSRTNSDLASKQSQISREMMKFQLDIRLDIGTMERRLNIFENRIVDEMQHEVRSLARSFDELKRKTETIIEKHSLNHNQSFINKQVLKNMEIEREIAFLKAHQQNSSLQQEIGSFATKRVTPQQSFSSNDSCEPLIKPALRVHPSSPEAALSLSENAPTTPKQILAIPRRTLATPKNIHTTPEESTTTKESTPKGVTTTPKDIRLNSGCHPQVLSMVENKAGGLLPRSVSITGKQFMKGIKDIASIVPDTNTDLGKIKSHEESKKWNIFGIRSRHHQDSSSSGGSAKFYWSPRNRRTKEAQVEEATTRSRSSTPPIPPIPRNSCGNHVRSTERVPTPFLASTMVEHMPNQFSAKMIDPVFSVHPALRSQIHGPNGASASSYETAHEAGVENLEQTILDSDLSEFTESPCLESGDVGGNVGSAVDATLTLKTGEVSVANVSPSTIVHWGSGDDQKDAVPDALQDWDHVSVTETKST
ncbi:hypothetical protein N7490_004460 [Penicillium lividum]|nr:hypothetical protein N7490_004460 [Penicillium lividum]